MEFLDMLDPCAIDILKDGEIIGSIQWHEKNMRLVFSKSFRHLTHNELEKVMDRMKQVVKNNYRK